MNSRNILWRVCVVGVVGLMFEAGVVVGEDMAPEKPRGVTVGKTSTLDLAGNLDDIQGWQLRVRLIVFEPGGAVPLHSHQGRPGIATVIQGTLTEHVPGSGIFQRNTGDRLIEDRNTVHWAENRTDSTVMVLSTDLYKP
jgi:quercetin dioxygenase-like cupin family protein